MQLHLAFKALHLFGAILWIGGVVVVSMIALSGSSEAVRAAHRRVVNPGLLAAWVGGLTMFGLGIDGYLRAGWLHGKITLAFIAAGLTGALGARIRKAGDAPVPGAKGFAIAILVIAALVLTLGLFGNVWMPPRP